MGGAHYLGLKEAGGMSESQDAERILLGVTGGIAAFKACELASLLTKQGYDVRVVMTPAAREFVGPLSFAAITGNPVSSELFDPAQEAAISHIDLARWAQAVVIAPATADFIARASLGLANDLLSTVLLATTAPVLMAPAMNPQMFLHPTVAEHLERLKSRGVQTVGPGSGRTACGEEGAGRMAEPAEIAGALFTMLAPQDLKGVKVVVTAGPTREHLDPVRYISNPSTGLMGIEVAKAAAQRGAEVTLVLGPTHLKPPPGMRTLPVVSAQDMYEAVMTEAADAQVVIKAAAVSDFRPIDCAPSKVKKNGEQAGECKLEYTRDILAALGRDKGKRILVGFAAETDELMANAQAKLKAKNLDILVANDVSAADAGFAVETNRVVLLSPSGESEELPLMSKEAVAQRLCERVARLLGRAA
jgi:phosphopantothenoylcysteine decarboxylase/phosphopantothenate--cysteine ligase